MQTNSFLSVSRLYWDNDLSTFPADVGLYRYRVTNKSEYYGYIMNQLVDTADCYFPFYTPLLSKEWTPEEKNEQMVDRIFLDLDVRGVDTFQDIWSKCQLFTKVFWPNIELFFSGGKGFHIYLYITPTPIGEMREYRDRLYDVFCTWFQYLHDKRVFLSLDRICRITLTKHSVDPEHPSLPKWKIPITPQMDLKDILRQATYPESYVDNFTQLANRPVEPIDWHLFLTSPHDFIDGKV